MKMSDIELKEGFSLGWKGIAVIIGLTIILCIAVWFFFLRGGAGLSDNGAGIDAVRRELSEVKANQQRASELITTIQKRIDSSAERIGVSTERITVVEQRIITNQASLDESGRIIEDSERILEQVRKRSKK